MLLHKYYTHFHSCPHCSHLHSHTCRWFHCVFLHFDKSKDRLIIRWQSEKVVDDHRFELYNCYNWLPTCNISVKFSQDLQQILYMTDGDLYTLPSVGEFVTNGSNHRILRQPDQVSKTDTMARGTRGPICGNQWSPPQSSNQHRIAEPQTAVSPWLGLISVAYWWSMPDDWLLLNPPQVVWFQYTTGRG